MQASLALLIGGMAAYGAGALVITHSHPGPDARTAQAQPTAVSMVSSWQIDSGGSNDAQSDRAEVFAQPRDPAPQRGQSQEGHAIWAKVSDAAELRSGPSSSATRIQSFGVGTDLEVLWRKRDGWIQVVNPETSQRGWMREQNLAWVSGRGQTKQKSTQTTVEAPVEVAIAGHEAPAAKEKSRRAVRLKAAARSGVQWEASYGGPAHQRGPLGLFGLF
jgi:Bacterial SH3 domain